MIGKEIGDVCMKCGVQYARSCRFDLCARGLDDL